MACHVLWPCLDAKSSKNLARRNNDSNVLEGCAMIVMRRCFRLRFMKSWICICLLALFLVFGNFVFLRYRSQGEENVDEELHTKYDRPHFQTKADSHLRNEKLDKVENDPPVTVNKLKKDSTGNGGSQKQLVLEGGRRFEAAKHGKPSQAFKHNIALLIIACNRPSAVKRCIDKVLQFKPDDIEMPIIVSQDCGHKETEVAIKSYGNKVKLVKQPDLGDVKGVPDNMQHFMGYYKIARHFKFALKQAFKEPQIDSVIIIEDDLEIAPDFFEYFIATRPLLDMDESIWCISAWNDNGKEGYVKGNGLLYRTDFFPGLGWMITRKVWQELDSKWPKGFWDDWMRHPEQRKGRACIRPEISRTKTFGSTGVSQGQFFDMFLKHIELNKEFFQFRKADLSYLLKSNYDKAFVYDVYSKPEVSPESILDGSLQHKAVRITYSSTAEIEMLTGQFRLMTDLKSGVPRTAYKGIISFVRNDIRIFMAPKHGWTSYIDT